ncbi:MAG: ABC transporter permease [Anaerolineae bacterium]|nr:ABC transporter permease [Anaerolineae bacterium]
MINELLKEGALILILASGVRLATPYLFAALGEMIGQRSGVLNLGVDGTMMLSAFTAFYVTFASGSLALGVLVGVLTGGLMGLIMAVVSVTMRAEQGISGIGLHLFGLGMSNLLFRLSLGAISTVEGFRPLSVPILSDLPVIGAVFFRHNVLVYLAFVLVPVAWVVLFRTPLGLKIRAVGENPQAADTLGVSVTGIRYLCVIIGGMMSGLAGTYLSIGLNNMYVDNITNGMGWIAVALVYFGRWHPWGVLAGSLLFSVVNALQIWVQVRGIAIPYEFAVMMPYVLTIVALAFAVRRAQQPAALSKPYERAEA